MYPAPFLFFREGGKEKFIDQEDRQTNSQIHLKVKSGNQASFYSQGNGGGEARGRYCLRQR